MLGDIDVREAADAAGELLRRRAARTNFLDFCRYTKHDFDVGAHHTEIAEALEAVERGEITRLAIFCPPRHSKSELASRRYPSWYLGKHANKQIITATYNSEFAMDFGRDVRGIIKAEEYQRVFPGTALREDSKAAGRWHTQDGGIFVSVGVGGPITGRGAHLAVLDDPIKNREDADSQKRRDSAWKWYTSTFLTRLMPKGAILLMMTRWHEDDLGARALNSEKWHVIEMPAIANEHTDHEKALWPEWYDLETLRHMREVQPLRDWSALYQQQPTTDRGTYCKRIWFADNTYGPDDLPEKTHPYICSDFAVAEGSSDPSTQRGPDWTEHGVMGLGPDGKQYWQNWWSGRETADIWIDALLDLAEEYRPLTWFGEAGVIRKSIEPFLRQRMAERKIFMNLVWLPPTADKAARGRAFQGRLSMGMVRMPRGVAWADRVIDQCVGFPGSAHDDKFDVMSLMSSALETSRPGKPLLKRKSRRDSWTETQGGGGSSWKTV